MKKIIAILMAAAMLLILAACSASEDPADSSTNSSSTGSTSESEDTAPETVTIYIPTQYLYTITSGETVTEMLYVYEYDENYYCTGIRINTEGLDESIYTAVECDERGNVIKMTSEQAGNTLLIVSTYNDQNNLLTQTNTLSGEVVSVFTYTYDEEGRHLSTHMEYPANNSTRTEVYTYDADRIISMTATDTNVNVVSESSYSYSEDGLTVTVTATGGLTQVYTYDEHGNLLSSVQTLEDSYQTAYVYTYEAVEISADDPRAQ